jgi:hypothetical protein
MPVFTLRGCRTSGLSFQKRVRDRRFSSTESLELSATGSDAQIPSVLDHDGQRQLGEASAMILVEIRVPDDGVYKSRTCDENLDADARVATMGENFRVTLSESDKARVLARFRSMRGQGGVRISFVTFGPLVVARDPDELRAQVSREERDRLPRD